MIQKEIEYSEIFDAQEHFRVIMNATARPGSIHSLKEIEIYPPAPLNKAAAYVALALMNKDVTCNVQLTKKQLDKKWVTLFDDLLNQTISQTKTVPVMVNYSVGKKLYFI